MKVILLRLTQLLLFFTLGTSSIYAQAPIKKPEKKQQTTPTTTTKPRTSTNTNKSSQTRNNTKVSEPTGYINGHGYVDLGLSVKWATCNVGASSPSDYGYYYAFGDKNLKISYTIETSAIYRKDQNFIDYDLFCDMAKENWGSTWRLPTMEELEELVDKCTHKWIVEGEHNAYRITGQNGNSIFLPAAGWRDETLPNYTGEHGGYWSWNCIGDGTGLGICLYFDLSDFVVSSNNFYRGLSVRPVSE